MAQQHFIGAHTIDNGGLHMTARRAGSAGMRALQCFTAIPRFYGDKSTIKSDRVERFQAALREARIKPEHVVVHGAYVLSVATAEPDKWERAAAGLTMEMKRSNALGVGAVCFHPGSATDGDPKKAAKRVADAITQALKASYGPARLLVETAQASKAPMARLADRYAMLFLAVTVTLAIVIAPALIGELAMLSVAVALTAVPRETRPVGTSKNTTTPEAVLASKEIAEAVNAAMDALPEELRNAIALREIEGLSYEEIAQALDCPIGTVRSRIFRAREAISSRIKPMLERQTGKRW